MNSKTLFRRRLLNKLQTALADAHLLLAAPPGYGKTILLQQLAAYRPDSYYLPLTAADSDTAVLQPRLQPYQQAGHTLLLDDVHHLAGADTAVAWLRDQLAQSACRYLISGRFIPEELEIALVKGEAIRCREIDLLFAPEESQALLTGESDLGDMWRDWHQQLEGWPLGLALLARLPAPRQAKKLARDGLFTYLARELFAHLPADLYHFMQVTAVPLQFDDLLAAHLLDQEAPALRQEIQRRNLFLYETDQPGHFRYHDLIRDYLLNSADFAPRPYRQKTIAWFESQANLSQAIDHALADPALHDEAARLIALVPPAYIYETDRYGTYRRWVEALDSQIRAQQPLLLFRLGHFLNFLEKHKALARAYIGQALVAAEEAGDRRMALLSRWQLAVFTQEESGASEALLAELAELSAAPEVAMYASRTYAHALTDDGRFFPAVAAWGRVVALAAADETPEQVWAARRTLALTALLPMGRFAQAADLLAGALQYFANEPGWRYETAQNSSELHFARGDWTALAAALAEIDELERTVESLAVHNLIWTNYYRGLLATANGRFADAERYLAVMKANFNAGDRRCEIPLARAECWLLRRRGELTAASQRAEAELSQPPSFPHYRSLLALEHDIATGTLFAAEQQGDFNLRPETVQLIPMRARPDLLRLRMLLTVVCQVAGDGRWRRHACAALYAGRLSGYNHLLIQRDAELSLQFWRTLLAGGLFTAEAGDALTALGQAGPLLPLLTHENPIVRANTALILAKIGDERAMPDLTTAVSQENELAVKQQLRQALAQLESDPPPPLRLKLMGVGQIWRGETELTSDAFHRPIVLRLLQYFALHRGQSLSRDRILEDLWPDKPPDKAWATFRSVYSRLRQTLEPSMRSNGPCRYVALEGESYRFDPLNLVTVDVEAALTAVEMVLTRAQNEPIPPLPAELLDTLEKWQPLIPDLPYEEWLLEAQEQLQESYLNGCHYVARAWLERGQPEAAVPWAQKTVAAAPWLEAAHRTLMRAYARQGQPARALKAYQNAVAALQRDLEMPPSPRTEWLAHRLRQGEAI